MYDTPVGSEVFRGEFGEMATNENSEGVLEGRYIPPEDMDPDMKLLLHSLRRPVGVQTIPTKITLEEFQQAWKVAKEKTTSSPHNVHFGHLKAIARDQDLSGMFAQLLNVPLLTGCLLYTSPSPRDS